MSTEHVSKWKAKSQVDYISAFMPLWLAFNSWMKTWCQTQLEDERKKFTDRECIELLKKTTNAKNQTYTSFKKLITELSIAGDNFKSQFVELSSALDNMYLSGNNYEEPVSFSHALVDVENKVYEDLTKNSKRDAIEFTNDIYFTNDVDKLYKAYLEIIYTVRCELFHGNLLPDEDTERLIKHVFLTFSTIMGEL